MKLPSRSALYYWFLSFIELQLLINLISLPVLAYWGLPISWLSPAGNLFFTPFLTLFLALSSTIFFAHLLHLPYGPMVYLLEHLHFYWRQLLILGSRLWLGSFIKPPLWLAIALVMIILISYHALRMASLLRRIVALIGIFIGIMILFFMLKPSEAQHSIAGIHGSLLINKQHGKTCIIDKGCHTINPQNFIDYTVMNALRSKIGSTDIECYTITKARITSLKIALLMLKNCQIRQMNVPYWQEDNKKMNRLFIELKKEADNAHCTLLRKKTSI